MLFIIAIDITFEVACHLSASVEGLSLDVYVMMVGRLVGCDVHRSGVGVCYRIWIYIYIYIK